MQHLFITQQCCWGDEEEKLEKLLCTVSVLSPIIFPMHTQLKQGNFSKYVIDSTVGEQFCNLFLFPLQHLFSERRAQEMTAAEMLNMK